MAINKLERRKLKKLAHSLKPAINIGKQGVNDGVIFSINEKLESKELIKIKFINYKDSKVELSKLIVDKTNSNEICLIGNTLIIYKLADNPQNRQNLL
tara:strand:+ start:77 stop:370 length:294 start_codon:yes stop_codon:yes gene_type:complete